VATLSINVLQSVYALKYPRAPLPPTPLSKSHKALSPPANNPKLKRKLGSLSPNTSPQRSFSSSYASSPLSTPSRTLNYTVPSSSPFNSSINSSFGSSVGNASIAGAGSPLAAYRGKHADRVGREFRFRFLFLSFSQLSSARSLSGLVILFYIPWHLPCSSANGTPMLITFLLRIGALDGSFLAGLNADDSDGDE